MTRSSGDTGSASDGAKTPKTVAMDSVRLYIVQGPNKVSVAQVVPSGSDQSFSTTVGIPEGLVTGPATVEAYRSEDEQKPLAAAKLDLLPR